MIVCGDDNVIRGFFNVCRHHAAAVMTQSSGAATHLQCPYHGWTYALDGSLKTAPDMGGIRNFDRNLVGLLPVQLALWRQWILVRFDAVGPSDNRNPRSGFEPLPIGVERRRHMLDCNWKDLRR